MKLRLVRRYCSECGRPMHRVKALINHVAYNPWTGKKAWVWYWGCETGFRGGCRLYLDGREYHDARRISTNRVRTRLSAEPKL